MTDPFPDRTEAAFAEGLRLHGEGRIAEAADRYRTVLRAAPGHVAALYQLGVAAAAQGRWRDVVGLMGAVLDQRPDDAAAANDLGVALVNLGRTAAAAEAFERATTLRPDHAEAFNNLGGVLQSLDRSEAALAAYGRAIALRPDYAAAHHNLGNALLAVGRRAEAEAALRTALRLEPSRAEFHRSLAQAKRFSPDDPDLAALQALAVTDLAPAARIELDFALGKALADAGRHADSLEAFRRGAAAKRRTLQYDESEVLAGMRRTAAAFDAGVVRGPGGAADPAPVFIVGMPRSGSTLVEQILAGHPSVYGAGERTDWPALMEEVARTHPPWPESAPGLPPAAWTDLGARYLGEVRTSAPTAARILDKMPGNFRHLGAILRALPGARIIHTVRDPIDTCLSCFSTLFAGYQPHTYDLAELGRYWRAYDALMAHWRAVLPEGVMIEVAYEDLVADPEGQARRLIAHLGLDWDPACLDFAALDRPVRTASAAQVREPVHGRSVGRWRVHGEALRPLLEALGGRSS